MSANTPVPMNPELCNRCAHCIAVCPSGAVEHDLLDKEQVRRVDKNLILPDVYKEIVFSRRSVRNYSGKEVPRAMIEKIIDVARYSPTSSNSQDVGYTIITDRKIIREMARTMYSFAFRIYGIIKKQPLKFIADMFNISKNRYVNLMEYTIEQTKTGRDFFLHNAPVLILIHAPKGSNFSCENCAIASTNIMNYSHSLGLASCYMGLFIKAMGLSRRLRKLIDIPSGRKIYSSIVLGYPAIKFSFTASRKNPNINWL